MTPAAASARCWLRLSLLMSSAIVLEAIAVRVFRVNDGRLGSYLGIPVLGVALAAVLSGIAASVGWKRAVAAAGSTMAIGGGAEILGLYGVSPFGRYEYTDWWLPYVVLPNGKLYPLLLPVTWFLVVSACYLLLARRLRGVALVAGSGLLAALVDLALEPVLTRVVLFWRWLEPTPLLGAPYLNFAGWLLTAGLGAGCLHAFQIWRARDLSYMVWMVPAALCFTAMIGLTYGEPRGLVALALLPVVLWAARRA